ncbi:DUF222 domain-containing protein [Epidermidibacterium keratini]|uniref:DUF222 domain-containing protein n=1 Tax=Epidermidibacterium keratini TaxID=1891644 RepID=A0A7L4YSG0_9ACTN|nr:DUF222 domain-containing protein [Epidermidibacterium keratini]QHC01903.1 DUF222 domain-containing protein [Epidermidibacterium keratini]
MVGSFDGSGTDVEQIDLIDALRRTESACAAARARVSVQFAKARVVQAQERGDSLEQQRAGAVGELALAHRCSPTAMLTKLAEYRRLVIDLPGTLRVLASGECSEYAAQCVARGATALTGDDATALDEHISPQLASLTPRQAEGRARRFADQRDPKAAVRRNREAAGTAHVSCRPLADGMAQLSIVTKLADAVAMNAALRKAALTDPALHDDGIGVTMTRIAFERITGMATAMDLGVEIQLVMSAETLLGDDGQPARMGEEYTGVRDAWIPAPMAREFALGLIGEPRSAHTGDNTANDADETSQPYQGDQGDQSDQTGEKTRDELRGRRWIRRLFTDPVTGTLADCDRRRRRFTKSQRRFIAARDQSCTTPWCGGPIRDYDHATPHAAGGPTDATNGNGKSTSCNHTKDTRGWTTEPIPARAGIAHGIKITNPTGHVYTSSSPPVLGDVPTRAGGHALAAGRRVAAQINKWC